MKKILCAGISTCDVYMKGFNSPPAPGTAIEIDDIFLEMGGGAANAMVDYALLGGSATLCLRIGKDHAGRVIKDTLANYPALDVVYSYDDGPTAISVAMIGDRDRSFACLLGTTLTFNRKDIPEEKIREADIIYIAGGCLMHGFDCPDLTDFFRYCKSLGKITMLDTAYDMRNVWLPAIAEALPYIDYFVPSEAEARAMCGSANATAEEMTAFFAARGVKNMILKMGSEGVYVRTEDGNERWISGYPVEAVDTTGAGDSFCAGFSYGLANEWPVEQCVKFGNAVGSMCVSSIGACTGIKSAQEVLTFIHEYEKEG